MKTENTGTPAEVVPGEEAGSLLANNNGPLATSDPAERVFDVSASVVQPPAPEPANLERRVLLGSALAASAMAFLPAVFAVAADANAASERFSSFRKRSVVTILWILVTRRAFATP